MNISTLNKLLLSRSLYYSAKDNIRSTSDIRLSIACNLLQDSVESFLLALSEHLNAGIDFKTSFDKYIDLINSKISPKELPFRVRLISLNKLRVNSKHYGLVPAKSELESLIAIVWEFFSEVSLSGFGKEFATLSLVDLLRDGESKDVLRLAESAFEAKDYSECLIFCRKVLFLEFEKHYDSQPFLIAGNSLGIWTLDLKVPYFARDKVYIEKRVQVPTDYIVYDHDALEMELMTSGVDSVAYWNVWRLTPQVYRKGKSHPWVVKYEFSKLDDDGIKDRAEYALQATTEILLAKNQHQNRTRSPGLQNYSLTLKRDCVPVYTKASKTSEIKQTTPPGLMEISCDYNVNGLEDSDIYWHVTHWGQDMHISGFIHQDEVNN